MWGTSREKDKGLVLPAIIGGVPYQILLLYVELEWVADYHWLCHSVRFLLTEKHVRTEYVVGIRTARALVHLSCGSSVRHTYSTIANLARVLATPWSCIYSSYIWPTVPTYYCQIASGHPVIFFMIPTSLGCVTRETSVSVATPSVPCSFWSRLSFVCLRWSR